MKTTSAPKKKNPRRPSAPAAQAAESAGSLAAPPPSSISRPGWRLLLSRYGWALAALIGIALYLPTVSYDFTFDDVPIVKENERIQHLWPAAPYLATSWWNRPTGGQEYRPATMASFALNYALGQDRPAGYHLVNILLHGLICALLWLLCLRLFSSPPLAWAAALLFAVHPVHVEAVTGIVGRAELLVTVGFLLALLSARASLEAPGLVRRWLWALAAFLPAALAAFSKEHGVMVLPAVFLLALVPGQSATGSCLLPGWRTFLLRLRRLIPSVLAAGLAVALYFAARRAVLGGIYGTAGSPISPVDNILVQLSGLPRFLTAVSVIARYGLALVAPFRPSPDYSYRQITEVTSLLSPLWLAGLGVLLSWCAATIYCLLRRRAAPLFGLLFIALTFLIGSNLFFNIGTIMAERLLYLPSVGFCLFLGALACAPSLSPIGRKVAWSIVGFWGLALFAQHTKYLPKWEGNDTLFPYMIERAPLSSRANLTYGVYLVGHQRFDEAQTYFKRAAEYYPKYGEAYMFLGMHYMKEHKLDEARENLEKAYQLNPRSERVTFYLARVRYLSGDSQGAEALLRKNLKDTNETPLSRMYFGFWLGQNGRTEEALPYLESARTHVFSDERIQLLLSLAASYLELGKNDKAEAAFADLVHSLPDDDEVRIYLAKTIGGMGQKDRAMTILNEILHRHPGQPQAQEALQNLDARPAGPMGQ